MRARHTQVRRIGASLAGAALAALGLGWLSGHVSRDVFFLSVLALALLLTIGEPFARKKRG